MVEIRPLRGVRFDPVVTGAIGPLLAPPYDVAAMPGSGGALSIRQIEDVDLGAGAENHALAASRYRSWLASGVLRQDDAPAIYVHRHRFEAGDRTLLRTGLLGRVRLSDWEDRIVLPHERTMAGPRGERLARLRAVNANLSPLYFLYRDRHGEIAEIAARHTPEATELAELDRMGGSHRLDPIVDPTVHEALREAFAGLAVFVADGHHRYEAALAYRNECRQRHGYDPDAPWEFVLALLASIDDPGVRVLPTHRVIPGKAERAGALRDLLARWFRLEDGAASTECADEPLFRVQLADSPQTLQVFAKPGSPHETLLPANKSRTWRELDVAALTGVLDSFFGASGTDGQSRVIPVVDADAARRQVQNGDVMAAFLLAPPNLDRLVDVAEAGDLLPPKSTWFEPKAPAGLVINDLIT